MSRAAARTDGVRGSAAQARPGPWPGLLSPVNVVIALATLVALGLRVYQVMRPGLLDVTQYDDGPYFGSAVRLVHGDLPYSGFALVQPPGITLLMSPVALLSEVTGTAWGLGIARLLTAVAGGAGVALAGLLVRRRGLLAVSATCGILAIYPSSVAAAHTLLLEPWLVLVCLVGAVTVFDGDRLATAKRLAWGGVAFGFAGAVKAWAIVPVLVILALCLPRPRRAAVFAGGVAAGFALPVLPFAVLAPRRIFQSVVVAQLSRSGPRVPLWHRFQDMTGFAGLLTAGHDAVLLTALVLTAGIAAAHLVASSVSGRRMTPLDIFATATAAAVTAMFLWPPYFASHYAAFLAPFFALAVALALARLAAAGRTPEVAPRFRAALTWTATGLAGLVLLATIPQVQIGTGFGHANPSAAAEKAIPAGACVLSDQVSYLLLANRFTSSVPGCPQMVDSLGTDLVLSGGLDPQTGADRVPAVATAWHDAFAHAQYVLLSVKNRRRVAWTPTLRAYFAATFTQVLRKPGRYTLYVRKGLRP